jgi:ABC-type lipoprotein export system ATPase subunit
LDRRPYIVCEDLFKIYKIADLEVVALRGLDMAVQPGEILAIVGASGTGKTSLLNILAGYDSPSAGHVRVGDRDLLDMSGRDVEEYRRSEVGFVWQQTSRNLFPYLTAMENVTLPMMLTRTSRGDRRARATELLGLVGLGDRLSHTAEALSGGEQQRVAIAVALANKPPLLLADEPMGELDDATASEVLEVFRDVNRELGTTIAIVTHDPDIAYKVGRVVMIRDGKISTEIKKKVTYRRKDGDGEEALDELAVVDPAGRVQLPKDYLDRLKIRDRAKVLLDGDKLNIVPGDYEI